MIRAESDQHVGRDEVQLERDQQEEQGVELSGVPDDALAGGGAEQRQQHVFVVGVAQEAVGQGRLGAFALFLHAHEDRGLAQPEPDIDREHQQDQRHHERDSPAPFGEHLGVHVEPAKTDHDQGEEEAERGRGLDEARGVAAFVWPGMLSDIGRGAAVFAAEREALAQAQRHQQHGGQPPDLGERRQQANEERRSAHHHDGHEEGVFASDQITDAAEDQRAERTHQETGRVGGEGRQERGRVIAGRKEQRGEEWRERRVQIRVVPLENRAERRGENDEFLILRHSARAD